MKSELSKIKQEGTDMKQGAEPTMVKTEDKDEDKSSSQAGRNKKSSVTLTHGYDYKGEMRASVSSLRYVARDSATRWSTLPLQRRSRTTCSLILTMQEILYQSLRN